MERILFWCARVSESLGEGWGEPVSLGGPWGDRKARPYLAWGSTGDGVNPASLSRPLGSLGEESSQVRLLCMHIVNESSTTNYCTHCNVLLITIYPQKETSLRQGDASKHDPSQGSPDVPGGGPCVVGFSPVPDV